MKMRTIQIKACGCEVSLKFKEPLTVDARADVISVLDRHARQIQTELAAGPETGKREGDPE